ncbi:hypothetical protein CH370_16485 [Leptospira kmetyi]|nr:hypothetical protein CH370_16485 [Leptospira kmetyi]
MISPSACHFNKLGSAKNQKNSPFYLDPFGDIETVSGKNFLSLPVSKKCIIGFYGPVDGFFEKVKEDL